MTWLEHLTGLTKEKPDLIRRNLTMEGQWLVSRANGLRWCAGRLEMPSLQDLRDRATGTSDPHNDRLSVSEIVDDAQSLHAHPRNTDALFQVASQFNLLEMAGPNVTPEEGVGIYEHDPTQGPACAVAAGAGTIYRNYFVPVGGQIGQTEDCQIDCMADLGEALGNDRNQLWEMRNGYLMASERGLIEISGKLKGSSEAERDRLRCLLRIGLQKQTQVTLPGCDHQVTQAYCSALPVAYNHQPAELWEPFARLVLEASYEATPFAGIQNFQETGNPTLYLTLIGGGVFGNKTSWILESLERALDLHRGAPLDVRIVSYRQKSYAVSAIARKFS